MRFSVEPSPAGGYFVRLAGVDAPVSRHDTEDEAHAAAGSYRRAADENRVGDVVRLRDGGEVLIRAVQPADKPLFARGWERFSDESRYRRFMGSKGRLKHERAVVLHRARPHRPRGARRDRPRDRRRARRRPATSATPSARTPPRRPCR